MSFWIKRFLLAFAVASAVLFLVQLVKGYTASDAAQFAALWGAISAALFVMVGYIRYKRNPACMLPQSKEK
jgi:hypothetical protein